MSIRIDGTNTTANPGITGSDTDTGLQFGTNEVKVVTDGTAKATFDNSGNLLFTREAASSPHPEQEIKWSNDSTTNNGFYITQDSDRNGKIWHEQGLDVLVGTNDSERMRITSDGITQIQKGTDNGHILTVTGGDTSRGLTIDTAAKSVGATTANDAEVIFDAQTNISGTIFGDFTFRTGGGERLRIQRLGGISFNGDTATANALDDYEEGTFTPTWITSGTNYSSVSYSIQTGLYTKIGNIVHVSIRLQSSGYTGSPTGVIKVDGLPFTVNDSTGAGGGAPSFYRIDVLDSAVVIATETRDSHDEFYLLASRDDGDWSNVPASGIRSSGSSELRVSFSYKTDS